VGTVSFDTHHSFLTQSRWIAASRKLACSFGWLLMAGADLFYEESTAGWLHVAGLF
jgi:hypothetical protein